MFHPVIDPTIHTEIMTRLQQVEVEHGVRILWAIESGSRAWGFHSPDSDYDIRFIYVRPQDFYLSIDVEDQRDVIEYPIVDDVDLNGWDIRKALRLLSKSNPGIVEWLHSPIVYSHSGDFQPLALQLLAEFYSLEKGIYHYRSSAKSNYQQFLRGETVKLKKYLYVLRPLLAVMWLEKYGTIAPIEFDRLRTVLDNAEVQHAIDTLLEIKKTASEKAEQKPFPVLQHFIEVELARLEGFNDSAMNMMAMPRLNEVFRRVVGEASV
jgi:predicted nucleotidyltransferase